MIDLSVLAPKSLSLLDRCILREAQKNFNRQVVELKSLNALVSDADRSAEKLIVTELSHLVPEAGFLTEEGTVQQDTQKEYLWVIILWMVQPILFMVFQF